MKQKYRLIDEVDMAALHGLRCELDVSANWIGLTPLRGGAPIIIAKATKSRAAKSNGQPTELLPSETPPDELAEIVAAERAWDQAQAEDKR